MDNIIFKFCSKDCLYLYDGLFTNQKDEDWEETPVKDKVAEALENLSTEETSEESFLFKPLLKFCKEEFCFSVVHSQMHNAVLIITITGNFKLPDGLRVQAAIKVFSSTAEGITYISLPPNTYFMISNIQFACEQYIDVHTMTNDGSLLAKIYPIDGGEGEGEDGFFPISNRVKFLSEIVYEVFSKSNVKDLSKL